MRVYRRGTLHVPRKDPRRKGTWQRAPTKQEFKALVFLTDFLTQDVRP